MTARQEVGDAVATLALDRRVFVGDDDYSGMIFFNTYRRWMSEGDQQLFAVLGHPVWEDLADGWGAPVVHSELDCHVAARSGDELVQEVVLREARRTSFSTTHTFSRDGQILATGTNVRVWVELATMAPRTAPPWTRSASPSQRS